MTDDIPASSQARPEDEAQGQKMTIYMPQGAVIIERSELDEPTVASPTQILSEEPQVSPKVGNEAVQSLGAVINIYTGDEVHGTKEQSHSKVPTIENAHMNEQQVNEQQVLLRISEMLDVITKRLDHDGQPVNPVIRSTNPGEVIRDTRSGEEIRNAQLNEALRNAQLNEVIENKSSVVRDDQNVENISHRTDIMLAGHHSDWLHAFNLMYISVILFTLLLPTGLHSLLGMEVVPALTSYEVAGIQRGDLLITQEAQASTIVVGDVLSLHNAFSGDSEVIQVSQISAPADNGVITLSIPPRAGQTLSLSYTVNGDLEVYKVVKSVPTLGAAKMLLDSFFVQFSAGLSVILLNVIVQFRRRRRYSVKQ